MNEIKARKHLMQFVKLAGAKSVMQIEDIDSDWLHGVLNTAKYEEDHERQLALVPTEREGVLELYFRDAAGYDGFIGTLTLAKRGERGRWE